MTAVRKRWLAFVAVLSLAAIIVFSIFAVRREPRYLGKTATEWLQSYAWTNVGGIYQTQTLRLAPNRIFTNGQFVMNRVLVGALRINPSLDALKSMGTNATPVLVRTLALQDNPLAARYLAFYQKASPSLRAHLTKPSPPAAQMRQKAAEALGEIHPLDSDYRSKLIDLLADPVPAVRLSARNSLLKEKRGFTEEERKKLEKLVSEKLDMNDAFEIVFGLNLHGPVAQAVYTRTLRSYGIQSSVFARIVDGTFPPAEALPGLLDLLSSADSNSRHRILRVFETAGPKASAAVPVLIEMLGDSNPHTRYLSARALEAIGPASREAIPALIHVLEDTNSLAPNVARRFLNTLSNNAAMPTAKSGQ